MIDPCILGGIFNGCKTDFSVFWAAVTAIVTFVSACIIYRQLQSLKNDSKMKAAESYVNLIWAIQRGEERGLVTQIAAIRAIRHLDFIDPKGAIDDLDSTLQHFRKNSSANTDKLAFELEETIAQLRSR
jgi:hypothetical protein